MGYTRCSVLNCYSTSLNNKLYKVKRHWPKSIMQYINHTKNPVICDEHFLPEERTFKRLPKSVIPSLFTLTPINSSSSGVQYDHAYASGSSNSTSTPNIEYSSSGVQSDHAYASGSSNSTSTPNAVSEELYSATLKKLNNYKRKFYNSQKSKKRLQTKIYSLVEIIGMFI